MAFVKVNLDGVSLKVDLEPKEQQYAKWTMDSQRVLDQFAVFATLWFKEQWAIAAADRVDIVEDAADKVGLAAILDRADLKVKERQHIAMGGATPADGKVK